jgi:hypothetical protein
MSQRIILPTAQSGTLDAFVPSSGSSLLISNGSGSLVVHVDEVDFDSMVLGNRAVKFYTDGGPGYTTKVYMDPSIARRFDVWLSHHLDGHVAE